MSASFMASLETAVGPLVTKRPFLFDLVYWTGPYGTGSAILLVASVALFCYWLFRVIRLRRPHLLIVILMATCATGGVLLQKHYRVVLQNPNLESIRLLPGYTIVHGRGDDSYGGHISRPGGLHIGIDIGGMAGLWANSEKPEKFTWIFEQEIRGERVFIALKPAGENGREKSLYVTYLASHSNFYATVQSDQDIAEMLCMVLTYERRIRR